MCPGVTQLFLLSRQTAPTSFLIKYNVVVQTYQMLSILGNPWNYQENSMTSENFVVQIVELFPTLCVWSNFEFETWIWCPFLQPIKSEFKF